MGVLVTLLFIPEITDLDLREGDRRWELIKTGTPIRQETALNVA